MKNLIIALACLAMLLSFCCKKSTPVSTPPSIIGTWALEKTVSQHYQNNNLIISDTSSVRSVTLFIQINVNGKGVNVHFGMDNTNFTYTVSGTTLSTSGISPVISMTGSNAVNYAINSLTEDTLVLHEGPIVSGVNSYSTTYYFTKAILYKPDGTPLSAVEGL